MQQIHHDHRWCHDRDRTGEARFQQQRENDRGQAVLLAQGEPGPVRPPHPRNGQRERDDDLRPVRGRSQYQAFDRFDAVHHDQPDRERRHHHRDLGHALHTATHVGTEEQADQGEREQQREGHGDGAHREHRDHRDRASRHPGGSARCPESPSGPPDQTPCEVDGAGQEQIPQQVHSEGRQSRARTLLRRTGLAIPGPQREHGEIRGEQDGDRIVEGRPRGQQRLGRLGHAGLGAHGRHGQRIDLGHRDTEHEIIRVAEHQIHDAENQQCLRQHTERHGEHDRAKTAPEFGYLDSTGAGIKPETEQCRDEHRIARRLVDIRDAGQSGHGNPTQHRHQQPRGPQRGTHGVLTRPLT